MNLLLGLSFCICSKANAGGEYSYAAGSLAIVNQEAQEAFYGPKKTFYFRPDIMGTHPDNFFPRKPTEDLPNLAIPILEADGKTKVTVANCDIGGSDCKGGYRFDFKTGIGSILLSPGETPTESFQTIVHEVAHDISAKSDGPLNFQIIGYYANKEYGKDFSASENAGYAASRATLANVLMYAASERPTHVDSLIKGAKQDSEIASGIFEASKLALSDFSNNLLNTTTANGLIDTGESILANGDKILIVSYSGKSLLIVENPETRKGPALEFSKEFPLSTELGRAQAVQYMVNKVIEANAVLPKLDPNSNLSQKISAQNSAAIVQAKYVVTYGPQMGLPTADLSSQITRTGRVLSSIASSPVATIGTLANESNSALVAVYNKINHVKREKKPKCWRYRECDDP